METARTAPWLGLNRRYQIVGVELIGLGAFLLLVLVLQLNESGWVQMVESFGWVYAIIGVTIVLVGLETLSLEWRFRSA